MIFKGLEYCASEDAAIKSFEKKFKDKTKNNWSDRNNFVPQTGKYTLIEMDTGAEEEEEELTTVVVDVNKKNLFYLNTLI